MNVVSMKCGATISNERIMTVDFDPLVVVRDAENENLATEALSAIISACATQLNDRIDRDTGAVYVLSVRVVDILLSALRLAYEEWEVHGFRKLRGIVDVRVIF